MSNNNNNNNNNHLTAYEIKRDERVKRNRIILEKLLRNNPFYEQTKISNDDLETKKISKVSQKKKIKKKIDINEDDLRRSGRIRKLPSPIYTTFELNDDLGDLRMQQSKKRKLLRTFDDEVNDMTKTKKKPTTTKRKESTQPVSEQSLKALNAQLKHVYAEFLGHKIETTDGALKAAVVRELAPISNPKFSKMSGIQEWKNCVVLYVNVGDKYGNSYDNVFTQCGGCITWFAQPRQDEESSAIRTILSTYDVQKKDLYSCDEMKDKALEEEEEDGNSRNKKSSFPNWPVHLFCRMEGDTYTYCGRLKALNHEENKRPMKFTFQLLDAPLLRVSPHFLELVELADGDT